MFYFHLYNQLKVTVWSRHDNATQDRLNVLVRQSVFPHGFFARWYTTHGDKELGSGPSTPDSLLQRRKGCCPEEVKQWVLGWAGKALGLLTPRPASPTAERTKPANIYLLCVDLRLVLSFREQLNVVCPVDLLCNDPDFILNWKLKGRQGSGRLWLGLGRIPGQSPKGPGDVFIYIYRYANSLRFIGLETFPLNTKPQIL